jgi:hypothetical protein
VADGKTSGGPDFAHSFHGMDSEFETDMTRVDQTWMCLRCQSLTERTWFIGEVGKGLPLVDYDHTTRCRVCGSMNLNLGASSCNQGWKGDFLVLFNERPI